MLFEYRQRVIHALAALCGARDILDHEAALKDSEIINRLGERGYLDANRHLTYEGRRFFSKVADNHYIGGPEAVRRNEGDWEKWKRRYERLSIPKKSRHFDD